MFSIPELDYNKPVPDTLSLDITRVIESNFPVPRVNFFDLDDTLIDRTGAFDRYAKWVGRCHGRDVEFKIRHANSPGHADYGDRVAGWATVIGGTPQECWQHMWAHLPRFIEPDPAVNEMLRALRRESPVGLISNGGSSVQRAKLAAAQLDGLFDALIISEEVGCEKPSPEIFAVACDRLGVGRDGVWMIGDDPLVDVAGAQTCGFVSCWVSRGRQWPGGPPPDHVVDHVVDLRGLVA